MLNLQQAKVLSALINNYGITDRYETGIPGCPSYMLDEVIEQIEFYTSMEITVDTATKVESDGTVTPETIYRLSYDQKYGAEHHYLEAVSCFLKEGIPLDCLK